MIRHLIIIQRSGLPLFSSTYEKGIECCSNEHKSHDLITNKTSILSSFLTALQSLATEFGGPVRTSKAGKMGRLSPQSR